MCDLKKSLSYPSMSLQLNFILIPKLMMTDADLRQHIRTFINYT